MKFTVGSQTDIGKKRSQNQDDFAVFPDIGLFVVSDGMGGHLGGATASKTAVHVISESIQNSKTSAQNSVQRLQEAFILANRTIYEKSLHDATLRGMGTTTTALLFDNDQLWIGHVGDSRCYYLQQQCIWQITRDHSLLQERLKAGLITRDQLKTDVARNIITRSVGYEKEVSVEIYQMHIKPSDCFLICSDGLSGLITDQEILNLVQTTFFQKAQPNLQETVNQLIQAANTAGGDDNITTVLVQVDG